MAAILSLGRAAAAADVKDARREAAAVEIRFWEARVGRDAADHLSPTRLGVLCLREGRRTGDLELFARAERVLTVALERSPDHLPALVTLTSVRLAQHEFAGALEAARAAHAIDPEDPEAVAALGDALLELGDLAGAEAKYAKLVKAVPGLFAHSRTANLRHAKGDVAGAISEFSRAIELGEEQGALAEDLAWCEGQLGGLHFGRGEWEDARKHYEAALALVPDERRALDRLAELHAAKKEFEPAISIYRQLVERYGSPELCQILGDVYAAMGRPADATPWHDKALAGYLRDAQAGRAHYDHHLAGFYSDTRGNGPEAVRWARKDLARRRTAATLDALAWALYADGKFEEAAWTMDEALALPGAASSAHVLYHASLIYSRAGDEKKGRLHLRRAAAVNPKFNEFHSHR